DTWFQPFQFHVCPSSSIMWCKIRFDTSQCYDPIVDLIESELVCHLLLSSHADAVSVAVMTPLRSRRSSSIATAGVVTAPKIRFRHHSGISARPDVHPAKVGLSAVPTTSKGRDS